MKELTLENIQSIQLELLISFDKVCRDNGFRYSLGGGTLLGAVRHEGFIPWDDDIDVMMPRPDYDRFILYCLDNDLSFRLTSHETTNNYYNLFAKIWNPNTIITDDLTDIPYSIGVNIDVFPIDGLGNSSISAYYHFGKTLLFRELLNASNWTTYFRSKSHSVWLEPIRFLLFISSRHIDKNIMFKCIERINLQKDFNQSKYAGCVSGSYREKEIMRKDSFNHFTTMNFEGHSFQVISDYHNYLVKHYGDYMQLPPLENQKTHHSSKAYYI